jgi:hypothetical protein
MTGPASVEQLRRQLQAATADLRSSLAQVRTRVRPSTEAGEEFERHALAGELGPDARELARRLRAGRTTWDEVLAGASPDAELLGQHVARHSAVVHGAVASLLRDEAVQR